MKRVALYARVSTADKGQDPETQLIGLRDHASHKGYIVCEEYVDLGWSGAKERRPQLDRMMADARAKKFEGVLVFRFDRFARSLKHLIAALEEFNKLGVDFISANEAIDTSTPMGVLVFSFIGALAQFERAIIKERVAAGLARARKQGRTLGRPRAIVDVEKLVEMIEGGLSLKKAAAVVGVSRATVRRMVKRHNVKVAKTQQTVEPETT